MTIPITLVNYLSAVPLCLLFLYYISKLSLYYTSYSNVMPVIPLLYEPCRLHGVQIQL